MTKDGDSRRNDMVSICFSHRFSILSFLFGFCIRNEIETEWRRCHVRSAQMIEYWNKNGKHAMLLTNNFDLPKRETIGIYDNQWQMKPLFKQPKLYFPLMCFYTESVGAIESQR